MRSCYYLAWVNPWTTRYSFLMTTNTTRRQQRGSTPFALSRYWRTGVRKLLERIFLDVLNRSEKKNSARATAELLDMHRDLNLLFELLVTRDLNLLLKGNFSSSIVKKTSDYLYSRLFFGMTVQTTLTCHRGTVIFLT